MFALSQGGIVLAGAPLALLSGALGWRGAFLGASAATVADGLLWWRFAADAPPGRPPPAGRRESLAESLRGQFAVWRTPGLARILALHSVGYAAMATLLALWAGPYLHDVHGLGTAGRGWALLLLGLAVPLGQLAMPPLAERIGARRAVELGAVASALPLLALALWPGAPLGAALGLLALLCFASAFPVLLVAEGRALFPEALAGRGVTTVNLAQVLGSALLPLLVGAAVGRAVGGGGGYGAGLALLGAALLAGLAGYRLLPGARPPQYSRSR